MHKSTGDKIGIPDSWVIRVPTLCIDAHPNVIIAHEFFLFQRLSQDHQRFINRSRLFNQLYKNSYKVANEGWHVSSNKVKGYSLDMEGAWQGRFTKLKVIGDKSGGKTTDIYTRNSQQFKDMYQQLSVSVKVPVKALHIIRNPFDMV